MFLKISLHTKNNPGEVIERALTSISMGKNHLKMIQLLYKC